MSKKILKGEVVSSKQDKTVIVAVKRPKIHSLYRKRYDTVKKLHAHDPRNECQVGDQVSIQEARPFSKKKRWRVIYKAKS